MTRHLTLLAAAGAALFASVVNAPAEDASNYPNSAIRIVVCVPAGGGVDSVTRLVAEKLRHQLRQPVVVENRGGQAGNLGAEHVYASEPDGYTLLASQPAPLTINVLLYKKLNYDPTGFQPVAIMTRIPNTLTVRPDFPAKTAQEFIAYAKANPGKLNYASQGTGTTSHLTAELFQTRTGSKLVHVPYKGTAPAINDLIARHVDLMFTEIASAIELHRAGRARILAVTSERRSPVVQDIPTMIEAGIPGFVSDTWNAISAPPKTPAPIIAKLNAAITEVLRSPDVQAHLLKLNMQPTPMTPAEAAEFVKADTRRWSEVIRAAGVAAVD